jgi:hypothetical protein
MCDLEEIADAAGQTVANGKQDEGDEKKQIRDFGEVSAA